MSADRRRHPRQPARFLVQHTALGALPDDGPTDGLPSSAWEVDYARDVSRSGLFIETSRVDELRRAPGKTTLHVQFAPKKDARLVSAFCRVTRVTEHGFGAEFVALDADAAALLETVAP